MLMVAALWRGRSRRQRGVLQDQSGVTVQLYEGVAECDRDVPVRQDVEVGRPDPRTRHVSVLEVRPPDLFAGGGVNLGDEWTGRYQPFCRWVVPAGQIQLAADAGCS